MVLFRVEPDRYNSSPEATPTVPLPRLLAAVFKISRPELMVVPPPNEFASERAKSPVPALTSEPLPLKAMEYVALRLLLPTVRAMGAGLAALLFRAMLPLPLSPPKVKAFVPAELSKVTVPPLRLSGMF